MGMMTVLRVNARRANQGTVSGAALSTSSLHSCKVRYGMVCYGPVWHVMVRLVRYGPVGTVRCGTVRYATVRDGMLQYCEVRYGVWYGKQKTLSGHVPREGVYGRIGTMTNEIRLQSYRERRRTPISMTVLFLRNSQYYFLQKNGWGMAGISPAYWTFLDTQSPVGVCCNR